MNQPSQSPGNKKPLYRQPEYCNAFYKRVLQKLADMLKVMKQGDGEAQRRRFESLCQELSNMGKQAKLRPWVELSEISKAAIGDRRNIYQNTARQIVREIKAGAELIREGQGKKLLVSDTLRILAPTSVSQVVAQATNWPSDTQFTSADATATSHGDLWLESEQNMTTDANKTQVGINEDDRTLTIDAEQATQGFSPSSSQPFSLQGERETIVGETAISDIQEFPVVENLPISDESPSAPTASKDNELISLFDDDLSSLGENLESNANAIPSAEDGNEILALFEDDAESSAAQSTKDMSPADELAGLLNLNLTHTGVESPHLSTPTVMTPEALTAKTLIFYEAIDTLDSLIETESPVSVVISEQDFEQLSAFIELPTHQSLSALAESLSIPESSSNEDDKFKDLEQLLEQTNRAIASQAPKATTGRPLSPARAVANQLFEQTMRVPVRQLDSLNNLIGELVVNRNTLEGEQEKLRQFLDNLLNQVQKLSDVGGRMQDLYERTLLEGALLASRQTVAVTAGESGGNGNGTPVIKTLTAAEGESDDEQGLGALEMDRFTGFHLLSQEMIELIVRVRESASDIQFLVDETEQVSRNLRQVTTQLQEGVNKSRMVPFAQTADRLPRAVRDISHRLNKQAELVLVGRDVLIDKMIVEQLYNPMTHLVNNAITHGIEPPHERQGRGKSAVGQIKIESFLQGNQTVISVSDDGAGIDPDQVKTKAIEKGLILQSEAKHLSYQDVYDLLFHPGFSTKDQADDFAGRGVGMDVVRTSLDAIRGSVSVDSTLGAGTTFTIRLPLTLSICKALSCVSERARIAFPMDGVDGTKVFLPGDVETNEQGERCVNWHERLLPLRPLNDLLAHNRQLSRGSIYGGIQGDDTVSVVFLRGASNLLAIQVEQVIGEQEIVIKQIEGPVPKPAGIAGATVLGDGSVMPIGDVLELIEISQGRLRTESSTHLWQKTAVYQQQQAQIPEKQEPLVLVVDDSITVRELLSISFGKAGYRVEQARDGQEAWEKIRSGLPCDLIFCDIEMPRMNGLELLSRLQKDEEFKEIPVAMLTSRGAERHRKVAGELGSCGYFTKPYTERDILDAAARMLKGEILLSTSTREPQQEPTTAAISAPPEEAPNLPALKTGKTVLIIDDSVMVREMLSMTFKQDGYHVEQARDGAEALEKLQSGLDCDVVFCDIEMPRMNGLELLSMMQQDSELSQVPVAMITSRGAERHRKIAAQRGARGYFTKPYIESELLAAAQALMDGQVLIENS